MSKSITTAKSAGFCYGVKRAVDTAYGAAGKYERIFTFGPIIHNKSVVGDLEKKGIKAVESLDKVKPGDAVIIRSHGVGAEVYDKLLQKGAVIIDATCPNVKKFTGLSGSAPKRAT